MSLYDYRESERIAKEDYPFDALIMAAMRRADSFNAEKLQHEFPMLWDELKKRYNAPGGLLVTDDVSKEIEPQ